MRKTAEKILEEYRDYPVRTDFICNVGGLTLHIDDEIGEMYLSISDFEKDKEANARRKAMEFVRQFVLFLNNPDLIDFYDEDNKLLDELIGLTHQFIGYLETIQETAVDCFSLEFTRLLDIVKDYYNSNFDYLMSSRDDLNRATMGIQSFNSKYEDTREAFDEFFRERIETIKQDEFYPKRDEKPVEKAKEM